MSSIEVIGGGYADSINEESARNNVLGQEAFLELLVTQLANQNPLNPMDNTEFVAQLAQFTTLEQMTGINDRLDTLAIGQAGILTQEAVQMVGHKVVYKGNEVYMEFKEGAEVRYELGTAAKEVNVTIKDEQGETVAEFDLGSAGSGKHTYEWNGLDQDGHMLASGNYTVEISAMDGQGTALDVETYAVSRVTGIVFDKGYAELMTGDKRLTNSDVIEITD